MVQSALEWEPIPDDVLVPRRTRRRDRSVASDVQVFSSTPGKRRRSSSGGGGATTAPAQTTTPPLSAREALLPGPLHATSPSTLPARPRPRGRPRPRPAPARWSHIRSLRPRGARRGMMRKHEGEP